jgi:hypothetical protein
MLSLLKVAVLFHSKSSIHLGKFGSVYRFVITEFFYLKLRLCCRLREYGLDRAP